MSAEIMGYKGATNTTPLTESEREERDSLSQIFKNVELDVFGDILRNRLRDLNHKDGGTDVGMFYCPYIPLMTTAVAVDPTTFKIVKLKPTVTI